MALYELRTYTLYVGKMAEARLYQELGFPALEKGGHSEASDRLTSRATPARSTSIIHLWKHDDDAGGARISVSRCSTTEAFTEASGAKFRRW